MWRGRGWDRDVGYNAEVMLLLSRSGGDICRRVHLVTVLLRPTSGHRPGRRQARHAHILLIGLRLAIAQADSRPVMPIFQIELRLAIAQADARPARYGLRSRSIFAGIRRILKA